ncbi:extracellular solute-binding protein [Flexivirga sp. ID2601S]|uniref:Extracellular solute-binding protein n=1 Tax=Flexivirga aerilata TaxID=1656889 RepID=A0A849ANF7_9MICO|nr:extracellular solute-binding protein [Flexivirga aerilata]NNG40931.1 extracellular solute-binding protein [Flexivirga aerilata]
MPEGSEDRSIAASVSRRAVLGAGAGSVAALLAGCGSPVATGLFGAAPPTHNLTYWNLFTGGDGDNMVKMETAYRRAHRDVQVDATVLTWGTPYYTKLSLATSGGAPPDVAVVHLSRLDTLTKAGLLSAMPTDELSAAGLPSDKFTPAALRKATIDGAVHAVPLDTHPFVMFYNVEVCRKAGLLDASGKLKPLNGPQELTAALRAAQRVTGQYGGVTTVTNDPSTNWRFFATFYYQLGGTVLADSGTRITLDDDKAVKALTFMQSLTRSGLLPKSVDAGGTTSLFSTGKAGFLFDGEWQIPTYRDTPVKFDVVPVPHVFGPKLVAFADSHALVIPRNSAMNPERRAIAMEFIKSLLDSSAIWAEGGHIPAWLPVRDSADFEKLRPQANYVAAATAAEYDPPGWYSGAGSQFENIVGAAVATSQTTSQSPAGAVRAMRSGLQPYASAIPPVG